MCPYLARQLSRFSTAGSKFLSIVRRARMVSRRQRGLYWFGPLRSNTLRPVCCSRVPEPGVLVLGVTSWSGEGVEPKSREMVFDPMKV
jgi:hypothetical protein